MTNKFWYFLESNFEDNRLFDLVYPNWNDIKRFNSWK